MAKPFYVVVTTRPPTIPLPVGSTLFTVSAVDPRQALRVVLRTLDGSIAEGGELLRQQDFRAE